jgi:predicted nucleic acid-binding protein
MVPWVQIQRSAREKRTDSTIVPLFLFSDLTLVTRNQKDFSRVPGLRIEDWSAD